MNKTLGIWIGAAVVTAALAAHADEPPPVVGHWQVTSDKTGKPDGIVETYLQDGKLFGRIEKVAPGVNPAEPCVKCPEPQRGKPFEGLVVLWNLHPEGGAWTGGTILDPQAGDTYRATVRANGADALEVRGYVGIALFGRTQTWRRVK